MTNPAGPPRPGKNLRVFAVVALVVGACSLYGGIARDYPVGVRVLWILLGLGLLVIGLWSLRARVPAVFDADNRRPPTTTFTVVYAGGPAPSGRLQRTILSRLFGPDTLQLFAWLWTLAFTLTAIAALTVSGSARGAIAVVLAVLGLAFILLGASGGATVTDDGLRWRLRLGGAARWSSVTGIDLAGGSVWRYFLDLPGRGPKKGEIRVLSSGAGSRAITVAANAGAVNERQFLSAVLTSALEHHIGVSVTDRAAWAGVLADVAPDLLC